MASFSNRARMSKGRIDIVEPGSSRIAYSIAFQFNPNTLTRTLNPRWMQGGYNRANKCNALRLSNVPEETIRLEVEIDAADQPENFDENGIYPQIAALEALVYPSSEHIRENSRLLGEGNIEIVPPESPRTLLVWGRNRVIPVQLADFTITEEIHDSGLNPIQAKVSLSMKVLSYNDVCLNHPVHSDFMNYHQRLEEMAAKARRS